MEKSIIPADELLKAYCSGYFPMADDSGEIYWHHPNPRAIIPLESVKQPRSLRQFLSKHNVDFRIDTSFQAVIDFCSKRDETWISDIIIDSYLNLHALGFAHSVETWIDGKLTGGLYGVAIGGAFFGESMFTTMPNASKAAFYFLTDHLKNKNFILLDSQYLNPFTESLGAIEIPRKQYMELLGRAINLKTNF